MRKTTLIVLFTSLIGVSFAQNKLPFPKELTDFEPYSGNPVFAGTGNPDTWDEKIRERGFVMNENGKYYLWYTGYDQKTGKQMKYLGLATSDDGLTWTRYGNSPVYRERWVEDMFVLKDEGTYYMFAESRDDIPRLFISSDRVNWKDRGRLDVRNVNGTPISDGPYGTPTVVKKGRTWYLYYERNDAAVWCATSSDLNIWTNVSDEPVLKCGPDAYDMYAVAFNKIILHKGVYYAYYHASAFKNWAEWTTNVAASKDLIHWEKYNANPILKENASSGYPVWDGKQYRFYTAHPDVRVYFPKTGK